MRLRSLAKRVLPVLALSLLVISCEDDPTGPGGSIIGTWRFMQESIEVTVNGVLQPEYSETYTYSDNIYYIQLVEITEENVSFYQNDPCADDYNMETIPYTLEEQTIYTTEDTLQVAFEGNNLVLSQQFTETVESQTAVITVELMFAPYDGAVPPTEWSSVIPNDSYEPDDTYTEATAIATGSANTQEHVLLDGDADWFSFSATSGTTYILETTGDIDTYLRLYDTDGTTMLGSNDDGGTSLNAKLQWTAPADGTYYFSVRGYADSQCGLYSISVVVQ